MFPKIDLMKVFYEANQNGGAGSSESAAADNSSNENEAQNSQGAPDTFEKWLSAQPADVQNSVKPLFEAHVSNLMSTVKATRQERDSFQKQVKELSKKAEAGSDTQKELEKLSSSLDEANRRSDFYETALENECKNPKAAFAVATAGDLFTKSGAPDWKAIQAEAPELFGKVQVTLKRKTAGSGTGGEPAKTGGMNDWIRGQAGITPQ